MRELNFLKLSVFDFKIVSVNSTLLLMKGKRSIKISSCATLTIWTIYSGWCFHSATLRSISIKIILLLLNWKHWSWLWGSNSSTTLWCTRPHYIRFFLLWSTSLVWVWLHIIHVLLATSNIYSFTKLFLHSSCWSATESTSENCCTSITKSRSWWSRCIISLMLWYFNGSSMFTIQ